MRDLLFSKALKKKNPIYSYLAKQTDFFRKNDNAEDLTAGFKVRLRALPDVRVPVAAPSVFVLLFDQHQKMVSRNFRAFKIDDGNK